MFLCLEANDDSNSNVSNISNNIFKKTANN